MPSLRHVHSYTKVKNKKVYRCMDPHCTHFIGKEFLLGKANRCLCGTEFNLSHEDLKRVTPKCKKCSDTKEARLYRKANALLDSIFDANETES